MLKYKVVSQANDKIEINEIECAIVKVHDSFIAFYADIELKKLIRIFSNTSFKEAVFIEDNKKE
ncbi:hypothetical protein LCGC14_1547940 [marine sediment metagenome]|uniref:Uncharacterized protein n=1 Tax=marine sediment metagenome TaxID=412755 RepID=A0A0F9LS24_9ZZZZ